MTSSESEGQPPPRKRSRASANSDDAGSKKARGRPRVDTQDATAADRRRTQIRLAQRAYRLRKETTISSLKAQNAQLQSIIEQMNKSFLRFNDSTLKSVLLQLNPTLAQELRNVTETFVSLAKAATTEGGNEGDDENGEAALDPAAELHNATSPTATSRQNCQTQPNLPVPQHTDIGWGYSANLEVSPPEYSASPRRNDRPTHSNFFPPMPGSPYELSRQSSLVRTRPPLTIGQMLDPSSRARSETPSSQQQLPFGLVDLIPRGQVSYHNDSRIYSVSIPTPEITPPTTRLATPPLLPNLYTKSLAPTWTYSHDETTFARRLTRAALETGFHLLSNANLRPAALNYVFKLSLPYMTLEGLRERFKMLLSRGTDEDLDCWETPFIHLGGAGTHYPRKDAHGNIVPIPNSWNIRSIGPLPSKLIRAENTADPSKSHDLQIDLAGFEGEWFDAYDVEGYLEEEKGCHIDPKDSFAEVLIEVEEEPATSDQSSLSFSKSAELNLDLSALRRPSKPQTESPSLSNGTSSTRTMSTKSTPGDNGTYGSAFGQNETFGLDMGVPNFHDFNKFSDVDVSAIFDQPLGLDLAPGFDTNTNTSMAGLNTSPFGDVSNFGLDLVGGEVELPVVKQKRKKAAWIDVSKLIDEIIKHGVCLGRAPGFRRKDVDMAFQASLIHAF